MKRHNVYRTLLDITIRKSRHDSIGEVASVSASGSRQGTLLDFDVKNTSCDDVRECFKALRYTFRAGTLL